MAPTSQQLGRPPTSTTKWLLCSLALLAANGLAEQLAVERPPADASQFVANQSKVANSNNNNNIEELAASNQSVNEFPLYMRIIATLACLVIFTVGVCGNLLVPLVVVKTKYLRNSTNLFLINLSVADLLVLVVCMPTVLIELHSRPETWLLGEPMCKLSNFVEMLAANGSIFTILAISFERYYAICKPLKAGYKCTRLRATIIICIIWLLSSLLTSPILMMAKSSETIYIDGSLVYNCILLTDSYWAKMYVFVSMFAFFCLPLLVLMFVYWLISRRLIRENLAMSTTTSLAASDSVGPTISRCNSASQPAVQMRKTASLRSISRFFSNLHHHNYYHHFSVSKSISNESKTTNTSNLIRQPGELASRSKLEASKTLSLDHHFVHNATHSPATFPTGDAAATSAASINQTELRPSRRSCRRVVGLKSAGELVSAQFSLANQFIRKLFRSSSAPCKPDQAADTSSPPSKVRQTVGGRTAAEAAAPCDRGRRQPNWAKCEMLPISELMGSGQLATNVGELGGRLADDPATRAPLLRSVSAATTNGAANSHTPTNERTGAGNRGKQLKQQCANISNNLPARGAARNSRNKLQGSRFSWAKSFSISSSLGGSSEQATSCTILPRGSSISHETSSMAGATDLDCSSAPAAQPPESSPKPIIHYSCIGAAGSEQHQQRDLVLKQQEARKKIAHFDDSSNNLPVPSANQLTYAAGSTSTASSPTNTSTTGSSSAYSSKSPSPELGGVHPHDAAPDLSPTTCRSHANSVRPADTCTYPRRGHRNHQTRATVARSARITRNETKLTLVSESESDNERRVSASSEKSKLCDTSEAPGAPKVRAGRLTSGRRSSSVTNCTAIMNSRHGHSVKRKSLDRGLEQASSHHQSHFPLNLRRHRRRYGSGGNSSRGTQLSELLVVQDLSKKQQMESRRQVVIMLAFVVACFFLLFFPYRVFTIWLILSTEDQVMSLGMETYYNLTYFSRILIYLHSAINPIAYNLISTKFRRAFMSILFCRGPSSRRHFNTGRRIIAKRLSAANNTGDHKKPNDQAKFC